MGAYVPQSSLAFSVVCLPLECRGESQSEEGDVERINQFSFYELGRTFQQLALLTPEMKVDESFVPIFSALAASKALTEGKPVPLTVSRASAQAVWQAIDHIIGEHFFTKDETGHRGTYKGASADAVFTPWQLHHLREAIKTFETVFAEEMREAATYFVPRRGIYYTPALVDTADESFPHELSIYVPEKTRIDWRAAGRCLAFNLLSASGFHVARAVEGTIEAYYQFFSGKAGKTLRSWHEYSKELGDLRQKGLDPAPSEKVLAELDQMRQDYRNPLMHPRVILTEADARMLFANGESLIILMAQELKEANENKGGVQQSLGTILGGLLSNDRQTVEG